MAPEARENAGEPLPDDQKQYIHLVFSKPYPPKLLNTPTSLPRAISPLTTKPRMSPVVTSCAISSMAFGSSGARNAKHGQRLIDVVACAFLMVRTQVDDEEGWWMLTQGLLPSCCHEPPPAMHRAGLQAHL